MSDRYIEYRKSRRARKRERKRDRSETYNDRKKRHIRSIMAESRSLYENKVREYEDTIKTGPTLICISCGQLFNKIGLKECRIDKCKEFIEESMLYVLFHEVDYSHGPIRFCVTCHNSFFKLRQIPRLCLINGLRFPEIPEELKGLSRLEGFLVSQVLIFMRISELRPTRQLRLSGNIVNVPIPIESSIDILPRNFDRTSIIQLVLKRALHHKSHYVKEYVRPYVVYRAAEYLVQQPLLLEENIKLDTRWLLEHTEEMEEFIVDRNDLKNIENQTEPIENIVEDHQWDETTEEDIVNPVAEETLLKEEIYFAPGEHSRPIAVTSDPYLEEKAFPLIYCGQKFESAVKISYNDRVKSEIRRFDRRSCAPDKLFAMLRKKEIIGLDNSISIYCKMISNAQMTVSQALDKDFVENLIRNDDAYQVLSTDRLSPVYWSRKKRELMAMIRTLGIPTFFLTLSAAETRWPELLVLLVKVLKKQDISEDQAMALSFADKCQLIRDDPVTCSRYFDRRIRELFKLLKCENGPFGKYKIIELYIRIEFQHRGSPHVHSLLWLEGAPKYNPESLQTKLNCEEFIEEFITSSSDFLSPDLYSLQVHKHTMSCKRMRGDSTLVCRFGIPHFPLPKSVILEPLKEEDLSDEEIDLFPDLLERIKQELSIIADKLKDKKGKFIVPTFGQFMSRIGCDYERYERAIRSTLVRAKVFLRRNLSEIRTNGFNSEILRRHRANMDLQFVLDPYATVHYILDYINKSNRGMSKLMKDVVQECKEGHMTHRQKLYKISSKFINCSEVSAQEAVYILLSMPLSSSSRSTIFINTGEKDSRVRRLRSEKELREMDPEGGDAMMDGLIEYYINRPDELNNICLAEFASWYDYSKRKYKKLNEGNEDTTDIFTEQSDSKYLSLFLNKGFVRRRKIAKIIRYRKYNASKDLANFMREKVMLYVPWRDEDSELINVDISAVYTSALESILSQEKDYVFESKYDYEDIEKNLESENRAEYERTLDELDEDTEYKVLDLVRNELNFEAEYMEVSTNKTVAGTFSCPKMIEDDSYYNLIRCLNGKQKEFLLGLVSHVKHSPKSFYYFLTGGAGTGKSVTIHAVYQTLIRWYAKQPGLRNIDNLTVLLTGPTGKSAFNIGGMTLHAALGLSVSQNQKSQKKMSPDLKNKMRNKLWNLKILIMDEVSMVGATTLQKVDDKLREIFERDVPFAGISILFVGDFNQLKPVCDRYLFENSNASDYSVLAGPLLWEPVRIFRLTECMRQRDDLRFAQALNNLAVGRQTSEDIKLFNSRLFDEKSTCLPSNAIRLFPFNAQVGRYNEKVLQRVTGSQLYICDAKDICPHRSRQLRSKALAIVERLSTQETYGLPKTLCLKVGVRYMITVNIDTEDGLVNGSSGILRFIDLMDLNETVVIQRLWIDFENPLVGRKIRSIMNKRTIDGVELTPISRIIRDIPTKSGSIFVFVTRTQFPIVVAEALTIHKSQGQTYDTVVVSVTSKLDMQLMYTAFSRAKSANGLYLIGKEIRFPLERSVSHKISMELQRLENNCSLKFELPFVSHFEKTNESLVLFFQNLPFLAKHGVYLESDPDINGSDLLFFVETHSTKVLINGFNQIGENSPNQANGCLGISVYCKPQIKAITDVHCNFGESTTHLEYTRVTVFPDLMVYIVYANPRFPKMNTIGILENLALEGLGFTKRVIIIGDLNIQSSSDYGCKLINMMHCHGFELMVKFGAPSTDNGTQIDYLFASSRFLKSAYHESVISDHKPIISILKN